MQLVNSIRLEILSMVMLTFKRSVMFMSMISVLLNLLKTPANFC